MRLKHCVYAIACFIVVSFLFPRCFLVVSSKWHVKKETMWKQALFPHMCLYIVDTAIVIDILLRHKTKPKINSKNNRFIFDFKWIMQILSIFWEYIVCFLYLIILYILPFSFMYMTIQESDSSLNMFPPFLHINLQI